MLNSIFRRALAMLLCFVLLSTTTPANASTNLQTQGKEIVAAGVAVVAAVVVVVVVVTLHYRSPSVKGCVATGPNGLELKTEGNQLTYELTGATSDLKPGEIVKVKGKKKSARAGTNPTFEVKQLSKDYGVCLATVKP
jgi:hypothetical protein